MVKVTQAMQESWNSQSDAINSWGELSDEEQINLATFYQAAITEGRRQMRKEAAAVTKHHMCGQEWPPQDGDVQIDEVVAAIRAIPIGDE